MLLIVTDVIHHDETLFLSLSLLKNTLSSKQIC